MIAGKTVISEEVFIDLAKIAMSRIESVSSKSGQKISLVHIARMVVDKVSPQVVVRKTDAVEDETGETAVSPSVSFDLRVSVIYGQNIPSVVEKLRDAVRGEVESITGYKVGNIDVTIEHLIKQQEAAETAAE